MFQDRQTFVAALEEAAALFDCPPGDGTREHTHFMHLLAELDRYCPGEPSLVARAQDRGLMRDAREDLSRRLAGFRAHYPARGRGPENGDNFGFGKDLPH